VRAIALDRIRAWFVPSGPGARFWHVMCLQ